MRPTDNEVSPIIGLLRGGSRKFIALAFIILVAMFAAMALGDPTPDPSHPITLRFMVWAGDQDFPVLQKVASDFEDAHPGVKVHMENSPDYNTYFQKLLAQYAAHGAPDCAMMDPGNFQRFAKRGAISPLNQYFQDTPDFKITDYYPQIIGACTWRDNLYILPRDVAPIGLIFYNKKMFRDAGLPYPDGSWTWDFQERPQLKDKDFIWVMNRLTQKDAAGKITRFALVPEATTFLQDTLIFSQGLRYVEGDPESPTKINFDGPGIVKTYDFLYQWMNIDHWSPTTQELTASLGSQASDLFAQQRCAMYMNGVWKIPDLRKAIVPGSKDFFDWDITLAPGYANGHHGMSTGGSGYAMLSSTAHPKEAWELIQWMAGPHGMRALAKLGVAMPAIQKLALSDAWLPGPNSPINNQYPKSMYLTDRAVSQIVFPPTYEYWVQLLKYKDTRQDAIWLGTLSAKDALGMAQKDADNRWAQIRAEEGRPPFNWPAAILMALGVLFALLGWVYLPEYRRKLTPRQKSESRTGYLFISPWLVGIFLFSVGPILFSLLISFADWDIITPARYRGFGNYTEMLFGGDPLFWNSVRVTLVYTVFSVPLSIMVSLGLALLLNVKVKGMSLYRTFFYLPSLASAVAMSLIWERIFQRDQGVLNTLIFGSDGKGNLLGLGTVLSNATGKVGPADWLGSEKLVIPSFIIMSLFGAGAAMVILLAGLQNIPQFYYEAATLDGAGSVRRFRHVTLPLLAPALFFVLITGFIGSFQSFTQAFVLTQGGPNNASRLFMYHLYDITFNDIRMGYGCALAWFLFIVVMVLTFLQFRLNRSIYYEGDIK